MISRGRYGSIRLPLTFLFAAAVMLFPAAIPAAAPGKLTVYTVNYPLMYFAGRIAGEHAEVIFPAPPDEDPAYWMPGADTVAGYQKADLILLNGAGYAKWVRKVSLPTFRMVDTSATFRERYIESGEISTHSHGPEGKHAHESLAFTTWLDLSLAAEQAWAVKEALIRKKPEARADFDRNHAALERDLVEIHQALLKIVSGGHDRPLVVSHPVYDYLAHGYDLNIRSVHWEPDEEPSADQWTELRAILREHPAEWMVWEGEPLPGPVEGLRNLGLESLVFDPCGNVPEEGDFLDVMRRNIRNLEKAF